MSMHEIENAARIFSDAHEQLGGTVSELERQIEDLKRQALPVIKRAVRRATEARDRLHSMVEANPDLFEKPRTQVIAGIRVGINKRRGRIEYDDEAAVIERIRRLLTAEEAEVLIRVSEAVNKQAVYDLMASDLKRLGIRITDDEDQVVIKPTDSDVDKLVNRLMAEAARIEDDAA